MTPPDQFSVSPDDLPAVAPTAPVTDPFAAPPPEVAEHSGSKLLEVDESEIPTVGAVPSGGRGGGRGGNRGGRPGGSGGGGGGRGRGRPRSRPRARG